MYNFICSCTGLHCTIGGWIGDHILVIGSLLVIGLFIFGTIWAKRREAKDFNGGICPNCGHALETEDMDSQGGEMWVCPNCDYTTWVSYKRYVQSKSRTKINFEKTTLFGEPIVEKGPATEPKYVMDKTEIEKLIEK
jgi:predicted RNA-binding Zn-ribbon protein involved in translation (DUF1610 family)